MFVREKQATFPAETADVGARGCRLALARPVARGALLQLRFGGDGPEPLDAVGQVVWTRKGEAGVAFLSAPATRKSGASWMDVLFASQLRAARRDRAAGDDLRDLLDVPLRLGTPPRAPLPPVALAIARVAERAGRLSEVLALPGGIATLAALVEQGAVTIGSAGGDAQGWRRALSVAGDATANGAAPAARAGQPAGSPPRAGGAAAA